MNKITAEKLYDFKFVSNVMFNPSDDRCAYQLSWADKEKNDYFTTVYINENRYESDNSTSIVTWKDNVNLIIREKKEDADKGYSQLYLLNAVTKERTEFLKLPLAVNDMFRISDNEFFITASIDANSPDDYLLSEEDYKKKIEDLEKEKDYQVIDEVPYYFNGAGYVNKKRTALFTLQVEPLEIRRITEPYFSAGNIYLDNRTAYFSGNSHVSNSKIYDKLYKYEFGQEKPECLYEKEDLLISNIFVLNKKLFVLATDGKEYGLNETSRFYQYKDNTLVPVKKVDRSLFNMVASDTVLYGGKNSVVQDNYYYTLATDIDHVAIWRFDENLEYREILQLPMITMLDVNDNHIIFAGCGRSSIPELYKYDFASEEYSRATWHNKGMFTDCYLARPEEIKYYSNNWELNGWVLKPKDFDPEKKYPAILDIHGGPRSIYTNAFFHEMQMWASEGYFVMFTNIHGSDGRGDSFADIRGRYGYEDYQDLMKFVDVVLEKYPQIDKTKLCETGGSYGGFMTNWIEGHTDRFCAVASQRSIANWIGFTYVSDIGPNFSTDQNKVTDFRNGTDALWEHSPLKYVDAAKTPILFIHSDEDYRCPLEEGMQMFQALTVRGVETRMVIFHGENHELSRSGKPEHRIRRLKEITDWFNKHTNN
ncbi:MAG: S9 family peptidase [Erysipelotrichaceae bacterium]|nr:S9 family peptidase [Erysipelotrichaceae bacterium]